MKINRSVFVLFQWLVTLQGKCSFLFWFLELLREMVFGSVTGLFLEEGL